MTLDERALNFVIRTYAPRLKDTGVNKNLIKSLLVGLLLKTYGYDDATIAAGYLNGISNQTEYSIDDIARLFGGDVASLVMTSKGVEDSLNWHEKQKQTLKILDSLPERNLAVICAKLIIDLEDIFYYIRKNNTPVEDHTEYEEFVKTIYKKFADHLEPSLTERLSDAIYNVFDRDVFVEYDDDIDVDDLIKIERINAYQEDLHKLKQLLGEQKPYIIEFAGSPKSGKSTLIQLFNGFLTDADFRVKVCDEREATNRFDESKVRDKASISTVEKNLLISAAIKDNLMEQIIGDQDVLLVENGLFNALVYFRVLLDKGYITKDLFDSYVKRYLPELEYLVNHVVICYSDPHITLRRDDPEHKTTNDMFDFLHSSYEYSKALSNIEDLLTSTTVVDTTKLQPEEANLIVADTLLPIMQKEYIYRLKKSLIKEEEK